MGRTKPGTRWNSGRETARPACNFAWDRLSWTGQDNNETMTTELKIELRHDYWEQRGAGYHWRRRRSMHIHTQNTYRSVHSPMTDSSAITQMDLERHFTMFALCLGPPEDLVSWKANRPLIWKLRITEKNRSKPLPLLSEMHPLDFGGGVGWLQQEGGNRKRKMRGQRLIVSH